jgi:hypothetical protein
MLTCITLPASAAESAQSAQTPDIIITPQWTSIATITNDLNMDNGTANILVYVRANSNITSISITSTLQKRSLLFFWSDVVTYNRQFNGYVGTFSEAPYVGSGTYRLKTTVSVYQNGSLMETTTVYNEG